MQFSFGNYEYRHRFYDELDYFDWNITLFALQDNVQPMAWNLFLAFIPLTLSIILFNKPKNSLVKILAFIPLTLTAIICYPRFFPLIKFIWQEKIAFIFIMVIILSFSGIILNLKDWNALKKIIWYCGLFLFIIFLPNACYVLTDIIHLIFDIRKGYPMTTIILFLIPQYTIFIFLAMESYTISIMNFVVHLDKVSQKKTFFLSEIILNFLSALGVYLGRFPRLNSWDIFYRPQVVREKIANLLILPKTWITIITMFLIFLGFYQLLKNFNLLLIQSQKHYYSSSKLEAKAENLEVPEIKV